MKQAINPGDVVNVRDAENHPDGFSGIFTVVAVSDGDVALCRGAIVGEMPDSHYCDVWVNTCRVVAVVLDADARKVMK